MTPTGANLPHTTSSSWRWRTIGWGNTEKLAACFDRAVRSLEEHRSLPARDAKQLAEFRTEAEAVLAGPSDELPADVFAKP